MNKQRLPVSGEMIREFYETDAATEFLKFTESDVSDDMVERAIQDCAEDADRAADALSELNSDLWAKENALTVLHADPSVAQALIRRYFVRANAFRIVGKIEDNRLREIEQARIDAAEAAADAAREHADARYWRHAV
jgi:hypothetical protein